MADLLAHAECQQPSDWSLFGTPRVELQGKIPIELALRPQLPGLLVPLITGKQINASCPIDLRSIFQFLENMFYFLLEISPFFSRGLKQMEATLVHVAWMLGLELFAN